MSFAQFNGVSSTENLFVNSITFADGTSSKSFSPTTYTSVIDTSSNIVSGSGLVVATFPTVPVGTYLLSIPLYFNINASNIYSVNVNAYTPTETFTLDYVGYTNVTGSGITNYSKSYCAVLQINTAGSIEVSVVCNLVVITDTYNITTNESGNPALLTKLL